MNFVYQTILENHPGVYNAQDPSFNQNLKQAYTQAKKEFLRTTNSEEKKRALNKFAKSFHDPHLWISWNDVHVRNHVANAEKQKFKIVLLNQQMAWSTLPTFCLDTNQQKDFNKIVKAIAQFKHKKAIIFDLRGNDGGNSAYGSKIIDALFGKEYAEQKRCLANKLVFVDWRASQDNLAHFNIRLQHNTPWLQEVVDGMKQSIAQRKHYYREYFAASCDTQSVRLKHSPVTARIIAIIDSNNFSAALDFIDELKLVDPGVLLIGQKTRADTLYMDVRTVTLPSGLGSFTFPMKVYRNRPRLANQPYVPDVRYKEITNTKKLRDFVVKMALT